MANMPEEMTRGNVAEEAEVSEESGSKSARDVSGSSYQDRSSGEVMVYMGQGFGLTCQVREQMLRRRWNFHGSDWTLFIFFTWEKVFVFKVESWGIKKDFFGCFRWIGSRSIKICKLLE